MWRCGRLACIATMVLLALACRPASAHDFWIEPTVFTPAPAQSVGLRLRVGENLVGEPVALSPRFVKHFVIDDMQQRRPVVVRTGADPAGVFRATQPGLQVVSYVNDPNRVDIEANKFNAYLAEEGLDHILALRAQRGQTDAPAREWYVRSAKSLLWSGPVAAETAGDRQLGLPLELVAEHNPYAAGVGELRDVRDVHEVHEVHDGSEASRVMPLRLLYHDQPLAGALVVAINSLRPTQRIAARSDAQGRVRLRLPPSPGLWLVKSVHMVQAPANAEGVQWLSHWASLTFAGAPTQP
jgi:Domain of unknown function (DUF4198)